MNGDPHRVTVQGKSIEGRNGLNSSLLVAGGWRTPGELQGGESRRLVPAGLECWEQVLRGVSPAHHEV